jgi:uncharacterized protein (TIGR03067 family)
MKKLLQFTPPALVFLFFIATSFATPLEDLAGTWTYTHSGDDGQVTQTLEIKKDKFTFRITGKDHQTIFYARGDVKVATAETLNTVAFVNIEGGSSADDLNPVNDDRHCVYLLDGDTLSLALDFDKKRDQNPRVEAYTKKEK